MCVGGGLLFSGKNGNIFEDMPNLFNQFHIDENLLLFFSISMNLQRESISNIFT